MVLARTRVLIDRIFFLVTGVVGLLSPRMQRRLAGGRPVEVDGNTLDPSIQLLLELRKRNGAKPWHAYTPEQARRAFAAESRVGAFRHMPVGAVRDLTVDGGDGPIPARHYAPPAEVSGAVPLLVYLHGGGFVVGDLDSYDSACRLLCRHAGVHVLSIDYRLAPEHPFPAARRRLQGRAGVGLRARRRARRRSRAGGDRRRQRRRQPRRDGRRA